MLVICGEYPADWKLVCKAVRLVAIAAWVSLATAPPPCPATGLGHVYENACNGDFPARLRSELSHHPWEMGLIDVTKPPYNAAGDGVQDDTEALQSAIEDGHDYNLAVYLPAGTYLISSQLSLIQRKRKHEERRGGVVLSQRKFVHQMLGNRSGDERSIIRLADGSGLDGTAAIFYEYRNQGVPDDSRHYGAVFRSIDIDLGNNPNATGLSMSGAQGCLIEDVHVYGERFHIGIRDLPGSGGGAVNIRVTGGRIGIMQSSFRPNPTITGLRLENQFGNAMRLMSSRGPLVVTGFQIIGGEHRSEDYNAIYMQSTATGKMGSRSNLTLSDGSIEVRGENGWAVNNANRDLVMRNVYIKSETAVVSGSELEGVRAHRIDGSRSDWKQFEGYYFASGIMDAALHLNGKTRLTEGAPVVYSGKIHPQEPEHDLISRHLWDDLPTWEDRSAFVDIVEDYGARRKDEDESFCNAEIIELALTETSDPNHANFGRAVLIPRGHFLIDRPIDIPANTTLMGVAKNMSVIELSVNWNFKDPAPAIATAAHRDARIELFDFGVLGYFGLPFIHIQSGETLLHNLLTESKRTNSIWPDSYHEAREEHLHRSPYIKFSYAAGGKAYNLSLDHVTNFPRDRFADVGGDHHILLIRETTQPLNFYSISIEHLNNSPQMKIESSSNVSIYGFKFENRRELLHIIDSDRISIMGGSGNYRLDREDDRSMIVVKNSSNLLMCNLNRSRGEWDDGLDSRYLIIDGKSQIDIEKDLVVYKTGRVAPDHKRSHAGRLAD